jgi:L-ornithine N5-oxygenase
MGNGAKVNQSPSRFGQLYDVVGVGFGPSNLALAIALDEHNLAASQDARLSYRFVERQPVFGWHRGMLIDDATMQVSFLKDLATPRNPTSGFSFVSYLHDRGRLADFINQQSFFPSRLEFHDYLEWAAARFADSTEYGQEVVDVHMVDRADEGGVLEVVARPSDAASDTPENRWQARNIVLATGRPPLFPENVPPSRRVWHSSALLDHLRELPTTSSLRFAVLGAGQSAAETVAHLHQRFPLAEIYSIFSRYGFSSADDTPFVNRVFDPDAVRIFFDAPSDIQESILGYHRNTNYSAVDTDLIKVLYQRHYRELVAGKPRMHFRNVSRLRRLRSTDDWVDLDVESLVSQRVETTRVDFVICATGYVAADPVQRFRSLSALCKRDSGNHVRLGVDHRVVTTASVTSGIYVTGASEHQHGLSSTLLSNIANRAGDIVSSIRENRPSEGR